MKQQKFDANIDKVLNLMINSIYTNRDIFLRELISNASDACDKLRYLQIENPALASGLELGIKVLIDKTAGTLIISDSGIGMNEAEMVANLGTIASSGTQKFLESVSGQNSQMMNLIGQFGVGFYSAFIVASNVRVVSRSGSDDKTYVWESDGVSGYKVGEADKQRDYVGTDVILTIKPEDSEYLDKYRIKHIITSYSDHISFPIELCDDENTTEIVNSRSALWVRPKSEISDEAYKEFYHHISHMPDDFWHKIHYQAEGNVNYSSLLYIPSMKPFDLFHPDRKMSIKLYIKRVFITEDSALLPQYMRFIRGIVDSEDLPLNISRETIQNNAVLNKIRKSLVKKILSELKARTKADKPEYLKFWKSFGEVMKEGLCEGALEEKEELLDVCRFYTSQSEDDMVSFEEYIERMVEGQSQIFFLTGEDLSKLRTHPRLEGFKKRGVEVLLLCDHVDDFWVNAVSQFKNTELKNISHHDIDLNAIKNLEEAKQEQEKENEADIIDFVKQTLGDAVKEVKSSGKLVDTAACLAFSAGNMSIRMEKILVEQKQLKGYSSKILEVNLDHPILHKISALVEQDSASEKAQDLVWLIFDQACILDGDNIKDPNAFCKRLNKLASGF
ncbi:MAG: molecular chaperone HtpG [Alphaproteobacteria bacterium]|nr:molecular chaperone HtpG [Candidatus Jidaibacter sp.]